MDLKNNVNTALLAYEGLIMGRSDFSRLPFYPQKTVLMEKDEDISTECAYPEETGLDSERLIKMVEKMSLSHDAEVHSFYMLSDGKCILSAAAPGYDVHMPHATFSMCKTLTGLAIGMLIEDGLIALDDKVYEFFPEAKPLLLSPRTRAITVEHLLTMQSGVAFNEAGAVVESAWIKSFLSSSVRFTPGKRFSYNSMNTYMLAAIVTRVTACSLTEFLNDRLFHPLGINNVFWEKSPEGIEKGGWGLYLSTASMAKIGQLFLNGGVYNGRRVIGEGWIKDATKKHAAVPDGIGPYDYGYHLWVHKENGRFLFNGMLGQNVLVDPKTNTVFAVTAADTCLFQTAHSLLAAEWALDGLKKEAPTSPSLTARKRLRRALADFGKAEAWLPLEAELDEAPLENAFSDYNLFSEHSVSANNAGILPMLFRLVQNNHSEGLRDVSLVRLEGGDVLLTFSEKSEDYTVRLGHNRLEEGTLTVRGEEYRVAAGYTFARDEGRAPIFKAELRFPELAFVRRLIIKVLDGHLTLMLTEAPGFPVVEKLLTSAHIAAEQGSLVEFVRETFNFNGLLLRTSTVFSPVLRLRSLSVPIDSTDADDPLHASEPIPNTVIPSLSENESEKNAEEEKSSPASKASALYKNARKTVKKMLKKS